MKLKNLFPLLIIFFFTVEYSWATDYDFKNFTTEDGLPHNYINDIYKDSNGFIWIATRNGVCKYDGYNFTTFSSNGKVQSSFSAFSQKVFEAKDGKIWVFGPKLNSYYYNGKKFITYSKDYVFAYPDHNGNIWFVNDSSLISIKLKNLKVIRDGSKDSSHILRLVCKERNDQIWVFREFSHKDFINSVNGFYNILGFNAHYYINNLYIDPTFDIWISTSNHGLIEYQYQRKQFRYYTYSSKARKGLSSNHIYAVTDINNKIYIGTMNGINILDKNTQHFSYIKREPYRKSTLSDNMVTCFLSTKTGVLFIGTRFGLDITRKTLFHHYYKMEGRNSISHNNVHGFVEDNQKKIWIISTGGLDKLNLDAGRFENYPINQEIKNALKASPISITKDNKDNFWIGTWQGGLYYFNRKNKTFKCFKQGRPFISVSNNNIMSLFCDKENNIWIGTWGGGLNYYNTKKKQFIWFKKEEGNQNSLSSNEISSFTEDKYGRIWIGTASGLNILIDKHNKVFKRFLHNNNNINSLSNNYINALLLTGNTLWIATEAGLDKLNIKNYSIKIIGKKDGLPSDQIKAVLQDDQGNLWVSTNRGLAMIEFKVSSNFVVKQIITFTVADGLQDEEFLAHSAFKASNGEMYFGGTNGFNMFNPDEIAPDTVVPKCVFTKFLIDGKIVHKNDTLFGDIVLKKPITNTKSLSFSYKQKSFSIEFSGLNYAEPNTTIYKYKLQGFDKSWTTVDSKHRLVSYTNINKGDYVFMVKAANRYNYWGKTAKLFIEVTPPFWETAWFRIIFLLIISLLIYLFIELRIKIIKKQKKNLEIIIQNRIAQVKRQEERIRVQALQIEKMNDILKKHNLELKDSLENVLRARVMQKLLDYGEFKKIFPDEDTCKKYLLDLKWGNNFKCRRCGYSDFTLEKDNSRRCKKCNYKESLTSWTIFHHLRFPIDKACYILIVASTGRKINISKLSRTLDLRLKTVWNFYNKVKEEISLLDSPIMSDKGWEKLIITPKNTHKKHR